MSTPIRTIASLLPAIAILAAFQAGPAEARGGGRDLHLERAERAHTLTSRAPHATDQQKAAIKDKATSDADPGGWLGLEWPDLEQPADRPFPRHRVPRGR